METRDGNPLPPSRTFHQRREQRPFQRRRPSSILPIPERPLLTGLATVLHRDKIFSSFNCFCQIDSDVKDSSSHCWTVDTLSCFSAPTLDKIPHAVSDSQSLTSFRRDRQTHVRGAINRTAANQSFHTRNTKERVVIAIGMRKEQLV